MRTIILHWSLLALASTLIACGDSAGTGGGSCTDGTKSMDPCPQTGTSCASVGGVAVACCVGGQLEQQLDPMSGRMTTKCQCEQASQGVVVMCATGAGGAGGSGGGASCGNGIITAPEQCDGAALGGASCTSMGMGTGMLQCSSSCMYSTSLCTGGTSTGGTGGGGTGG